MAHIDIVGCGPGNPSLLTSAACEVVKQANVLYGSNRVINMFPEFQGKKVIIEGNFSHILDRIEQEIGRLRVVILVTGDVGFHSFASLVVKRVGRERCRLHSGISSIQYAFNRLCLSWEDALFLSSHGEEIEDKEKRIREHDKIGIITGGENGVRAVFEDLDFSLFKTKRIFVLENLSFPDERIREITNLRDVHSPFSSLSVVIIVERVLYE
jgi:precorrin-6y C5,15-methyltransferase (decarboxylating) CbiE subunit